MKWCKIIISEYTLKIIIVSVISDVTEALQFHVTGLVCSRGHKKRYLLPENRCAQRPNYLAFEEYAVFKQLSI